MTEEEKIQNRWGKKKHFQFLCMGFGSDVGCWFAPVTVGYVVWAYEGGYRDGLHLGESWHILGHLWQAFESKRRRVGTELH